MKKALVSITSGQGDKLAQIWDALERISFGNKLVSVSNVYESFSDGQIKVPRPFLTAAALIETDMSPTQLLQFLKEIEGQIGKAPGALSPIDLDITLMDKVVLRTPELTLPHPLAHVRPHILVPASEIAPDWKHPLVDQTLEKLTQTLLAEVPQWGKFHCKGVDLGR